MPATKTREPYAYRADPLVPDFDDSGPVTFMDGKCVLCSRGARLIARFDRANEFKICPIQSELGQAMLRHFGLKEADPESWIYLVDGRAYTSFEAMIRAGARVGGIGWTLQIFRLVPRSAQDWLYGHIARNRYRLFGQADMCALPDPSLQQRLIG